MQHNTSSIQQPRHRQIKSWLACLGALLIVTGFYRAKGDDAETSPTASKKAAHANTSASHATGASSVHWLAIERQVGGDYRLCGDYQPIPQACDGCNAAAGPCPHHAHGMRHDSVEMFRARPINWQQYAQGEYVGHHRTQHVPEYRLRVDDLLEFVYRLTRQETSRPYEMNVGDEIRIESITDPTLDGNLIVQPDGSITLRLLGQVRAVRRTVSQLRDELETLYTRFYKEPAITVTPIKMNAKLEDLRATVDGRAGQGGQSRQARVTPEGTIALPAVGSVVAQGLTLNELKRELDERYAMEVEGIEVTPVLLQRAPRYIYVLGEVRMPGRYTLEGPTTVMQAISMAQGWNVGANLGQVVVFRRDDQWQLMGTMLNLRTAVRGKDPCPADEIWLNDSDLVILPKSKILLADDFINLVFTRGIYGVVPFSTSVSYSNLSSFGG